MTDVPVDGTKEGADAAADGTDASADASSERTDEGADAPDDGTDGESDASSDDSSPTTDSSSGDGTAEDQSYEARGSGIRSRDVEVPMRVYKTVTVFSTLIAVVSVLAGFVLLDRATERAQLPLSAVDPILALLGIGTILFGAAVYAYGTRFRARGMGRSKNGDDETADNG